MHKKLEKILEIIIKAWLYFVKAYAIFNIIIASLFLGTYITSPLTINGASSDISAVNSAIAQVNASNLNLAEKQSLISNYESLNQALYDLKQAAAFNITPIQFIEEEAILIIPSIILWIMADYLGDKLNKISKEDENNT